MCERSWHGHDKEGDHLDLEHVAVGEPKVLEACCEHRQPTGEVREISARSCVG